MSAKHLPVYKEATRLVGHLYATTKNAPREFRHTLVSRLLNEAVELVVDIDHANRVRGQERATWIKESQRRVARLSVLLTAAWEQRCLSTGAMALCVKAVDMLGKQLFGWMRHTASSLAAFEEPESEPSTR